MKQVCILIDDSILSHHHGVRKYLFSLASVIGLDAGVNVDLLLFKDSKYYKLNLNKCDLASNGYTKDALFAVGKKRILDKLKEGKIPPQFSPDAFKWKECRPDKMKVYDVCLLGGPWCHNKVILPLSKKHYCVAHDAVPNFYALSRPYDQAVWAFALEHIEAYIAYTEKFDGIVATGSASANQCAAVLGSSHPAIITLPVFLPAGFDDLSSRPCAGRVRNQIVLAAPFDLRKGLKRMPQLIKASGANSIVIFGGVRCDIGDVIDFFSHLDAQDITWWSSVTLARQINLYRESLFLLFPSLNEGLGLPVLEAFACGLPAIVSDIVPLNKLSPRSFILEEGIGATDIKSKFKLASRIALNAKWRGVVADKSLNRWGRTAVKRQILNSIGVLA